MAPSSRIEEARRRVRLARYVIASIAAAGFGGAVAATGLSHPVTHHSTRRSTQAAASDDLGFGSGSYIAPAESAPTIQSGGS